MHCTRIWVKQGNKMESCKIEFGSVHDTYNIFFKGKKLRKLGRDAYKPTHPLMISLAGLKVTFAYNVGVRNNPLKSFLKL